MQVGITARHGGLSASKEEYIRTKAERLVRYFERVTAVNVTVHFENDRATVELLVDAEHKHDFVARAANEDVLAAFDQALHKMEEQIRRYKERIQDHRRDVSPRHLAELERGASLSEPGTGVEQTEPDRASSVRRDEQQDASGVSEGSP